jgi:hypothetical protein
LSVGDIGCTHVVYLLAGLFTRGRRLTTQAHFSCRLNEDKLGAIKYKYCVGKKVVDMSIDRAGGQYWLKPVNTGQYWLIENSLVNKVFFLVILLLQVAIKVNL